MDDALAESRRVLFGLQRERNAATERKGHLAGAREAVAYSAATGDRAARKTLDALTLEAARIDLEIENITSAISEAERRVRQAEADVARENDRERARQARLLLEDLRKAGAEASSALDIFVTQLQQFEAVANELGRLGVGAPRHDLVRINLRRSVQTGLYRVGLGQLLSPSERIDLADLVARMCARVEGGIAQLLGEPAQEEAA